MENTCKFAKLLFVLILAASCVATEVEETPDKPEHRLLPEEVYLEPIATETRSRPQVVYDFRKHDVRPPVPRPVPNYLLHRYSINNFNRQEVRRRDGTATGFYSHSLPGGGFLQVQYGAGSRSDTETLPASTTLDIIGDAEEEVTSILMASDLKEVFEGFKPADTSPLRAPSQLGLPEGRSGGIEANLDLELPESKEEPADDDFLDFDDVPLETEDAARTLDWSAVKNAMKVGTDFNDKVTASKFEITLKGKTVKFTGICEALWFPKSRSLSVSEGSRSPRLFLKNIFKKKTTTTTTTTPSPSTTLIHCCIKLCPAGKLILLGLCLPRVQCA